MTKIAIQPNASGSGTFTLTAPDSNDNRTFTLPDATGEVYTSGNILGTVSQSGGVPTGAIIERGSNANGEFVRYADGTQICWRSSGTPEARGLSFSERTESGFTGYFAADDWTFPAVFSQAPAVSANFKGLTSGGSIRLFVGSSFNVVNTTIATIRRWGAAANLADVTGISDTAIGRWF